MMFCDLSRVEWLNSCFDSVIVQGSSPSSAPHQMMPCVIFRFQCTEKITGRQKNSSLTGAAIPFSNIYKAKVLTKVFAPNHPGSLAKKRATSQVRSIYLPQPEIKEIGHPFRNIFAGRGNWAACGLKIVVCIRDRDQDSIDTRINQLLMKNQRLFDGDRII